MRRRVTAVLLLLLALGALPLLAGCGSDEEELVAKEGEPLEIGDLLYNVQLTRFLSPDSPEDSAYLDGVDAVQGQDQDYLAVFLRIENESSEPVTLPTYIAIRSSRDEVFDPLSVDNPFALQLGSEIPGDGTIPAPDTPAASGPIKGAMLLYLIDVSATENRPLELEIPGPNDEVGVIDLDI